MELQKIAHEFSVCKVADDSQVDLNAEYCFIGKTDAENSVVCLSAHVPENATVCEHGWKAFRIKGILDFSMIGVLSDISAVLAKNQIGIFVISTYNTDYIFVKKESFDPALQALAAQGYTVV